MCFCWVLQAFPTLLPLWPSCLCPIRLTLTLHCANVCTGMKRDRIATFSTLPLFLAIFTSSHLHLLCQAHLYGPRWLLTVSFFLLFFSSFFLHFPKSSPNKLPFYCLVDYSTRDWIAAAQCTRIMAYGNQCAKEEEERGKWRSRFVLSYLSPSTCQTW